MMRATVRASHLAAAMKHSIAQRTGQLPMLQHALVETDGAHHIAITTTDLETYCRTTLPATIEEEGGAAVEAGKFGAACALGESLQLVEEEGAVRVQGTGRNRVKVPALPAVEFPTADEESWRIVDVNATDLRQALESVLYAAPTDDVRYYLNCVCLADGWAAAGDGKAMARAPCEYAGPALMIPTRRVQAIVRLLATGVATFEVACARDGSARLLRVSKVGGDDGVSVALTVLLVSGQFPDMARLVESFTSDEWHSTLDRAEISGAIVGLLPFTTLLGKAPFAELVADEDGIRMRAGSDGEIALPAARDTEGDGVRAGVRMDSLGKALDAGETQWVRIAVSRPSKNQRAIVLTSDDRSVHLIAESNL